MTDCPRGQAASGVTPRVLAWMAVGVRVALAEMGTWEKQQVLCPLTRFQHSLSCQRMCPCVPPQLNSCTPLLKHLCLLLMQHRVDPRRPLHMSMEWAKEGSVSPRAQEEEAGLLPMFLVPWPWKQGGICPGLLSVLSAVRNSASGVVFSETLRSHLGG